MTFGHEGGHAHLYDLQHALGSITTGNLSKAFEKLRHDIQLTDAEKLAIKVFTDMFITCTLNPDTVHEDKSKGKKIVDIINEVNCHNCTKKCKITSSRCANPVKPKCG